MEKLLVAVCSLLSISLPGGCSVRGLPGDDGVSPTIVHTEVVLLPGADMTPFDVPEFSTRAADPHECRVRHIVEVYADDEFGQNLQFRRQLICGEEDTEDVTLECDLRTRNYRVVAWRDFMLVSGVSSNITDNCFYTTSDFSVVKLKEDYTGGADYEDMFCRQAALDLSPYRCQSEAGHREEMQLEHPLARVELITTDIVKYLNKLEQTKNIQDAAIGDFMVQVLYTGYFPVGFNVVSNRPNEAVMGIKFISNLLILLDNGTCLAFDYVLVNSEESSVTLEMTIYNEEGQEVNRVTGVEVPLERNGMTMVRDELLTHEFIPDIGINPGSDGEVNVVVP